MKIILNIFLLTILINTITSAQIYDIINKQLYLKSSYQPEKFYLEKRTTPFEWSYSRELAIPDSQIVSIVVFNSKKDTVKIIHDDWLKRGLYDIRWNLTKLTGEEIEDDLYTIIIKTRVGKNEITDSTIIHVFGRKYYKPLKLSSNYLFEFEKIETKYRYIGSGDIEKGEINDLKNFEIHFKEVELDTFSNSSITIEGRIKDIGKQFGGIPYFEIINCLDNLNFEKIGQLGLSSGVITDGLGNFRIHTIVFPNTKIYFLHKDYLIKCFDIGELSSLYKNNPEMQKKYEKKEITK